MPGHGFPCPGRDIPLGASISLPRHVYWYPCPGMGILLEGRILLHGQYGCSTYSRQARETHLSGLRQRFSFLKKNTHAGAGILNTHAGAGIYLPPGGYPCPGMEIHARASIVVDCIFHSNVYSTKKFNSPSNVMLFSTIWKHQI